jgi:surface antigen
MAAAGVTQTSSSIKANSSSRLNNGEASALEAGIGRSLAAIKQSIMSGGSWRLASHALLIAVVVCIALAGKVQADSITVIRPGAQESAPQDQSGELQSGAILAQQAQLLIASDVQERATTSVSQIQLATTDENFLTKKAPITAGQPVKRTVSSYTITQGDTASSIAAKFGVTTDTLFWANNLADNATLKPGQQLMILPVNGLLYTAKGDEDVAGLATTYQASANLIDSYNQLEGKALAAGQKIIIPDGVKPEVKKTTPVAPVVSSTRIASSGTTLRAGSFSNSYSMGYCTYYVASRRAVPSNWGNASSWYYNAIASGYGVGTTPRAGAVAWEFGNHVAYVERVNGDGTVTVSEMNFFGNGGGWNRVSQRTTSASKFKYIY